MSAPFVLQKRREYGIHVAVGACAVAVPSGAAHSAFMGHAQGAQGNP